MSSLSLLFSACKKDPTTSPTTGGGGQGATFCSSKIASITMPQTDVFHGYPFNFVGCPATGINNVVSDSNVYHFRSSNPNNENEFCYFRIGPTPSGWELAS